jgi:hypothetical protein
MLKLMLLAGSVALIPVSASAQVVNGGFEAPVVTNSCCNTVPPDPLAGWTVNFGNVNVVNGTFSSTAGNLAAEGNQYLDLVGQGGLGSISQVLTLIPNSIYNLSFVYSHNLFAGTPSATAAFSLDGLSGVLTHSTGSTSDLDWQTFSQNFTATGPSATLTFTNLTGGANEGIFLDAVSVGAAVPEPATWALMLLGFGFIGGAMRSAKRRQRLSVAYAA